MAACPKCGEKNADDAKMCGMCGEVLQKAVATATPQVPTTGMTAPRPVGSPGQSTMVPPTPFGVKATQRPVEYAGFWLRLVAVIIDGLVLGIPMSVLSFVVFILPMMSAMGPGGSSEALPMAIAMSMAKWGTLLNLASLVASWLYFTLMESSGKQATLGKMALGLIVTDTDGNRIEFGRATGRFFGKIVSSILCIGYIMAGFTEKKQGLHDMMASCLVVKR